MASDWRITL